MGGLRMIGLPAPPITGAHTPEWLRSCLGRMGDRDAPCGGHVREDFQPSSNIGRYTRVPPVLTGPLGTLGKGPCACALPTPPHTAADTPESLRWRLGCMGDEDAPWGDHARLDFQLLPTQRRIHPSPSGLSRAVWGIGAPHGVVAYDGPSSSPHTAVNAPESLRSYLGRLGERGASCGGHVPEDLQPFPHSGGCTRVPPGLSRPFGG